MATCEDIEIPDESEKRLHQWVEERLAALPPGAPVELILQRPIPWNHS